MSAHQLASRLARRCRQRWVYPRLGERLYPTPAPLAEVVFPDLPDDGALGLGDSPRPGRAADLAAGRFAFLGLPPVDLGSPVDWTHTPEGNRLWQYELHYGGWALDLAATKTPRHLDALLALLDDWTRSNPAGSSPGWEPYPICRRLVAWSRLPGLLGEAAPLADFWRQRLEPSLRRQTTFLAHNLEHDVPNNHLLANYRTLAWMGLACPHWPESARWRRHGLVGLWREMRRQVLADGVHDERSTSYHAIVLLDLLETWQLARHRGVSEGSAELPADALPTLRRMLGVLAALDPGEGGRWPLLNDSVPGYPCDPREILAAAKRLGLEPELPAEPRTLVFPDAGWALWRGPGTPADELLIFDAGALGPDRVLGHGHADTLGFELHWRGRPLVVDPGVVTYESGPWRDRLRSTAAHNTVTIDGQDQCLFWGPFRVAYPPRARLLRADDSVLEGEHHGYHRLAEPVVHRRRITRPAPGTWEIHDSFSGQGTHRFALTLQWAPGARVDVEPTTLMVRWDEQDIMLRVEALEPADGAAWQLEDGVVAAGWNDPRPAPRVVFGWHGDAPCEIRICLRIEPLAPRG